MADERASSIPPNRRGHQRYPTSISVDYTSGENFLFSYIQNISEMGIFIRSDEPMPIGSRVRMRFADEEGDPLEIKGEVVWVNAVKADGENLNPGMGVRFDDLSPEHRERVVSLVRTVAYLQDQPADNKSN